MIDHFGRGLAPAATALYAAGGAGIILASVAVVQGGLAVRFAPVAWLAVVLLAVVCTVLAFLAFLRGLATIGPVRTAIVSTIEPFWTALLGSVVLGQELAPRTVAGGVCIAAAVILLQFGPRTSATPAPAA
jgi:drug/metabolite transporter (DMT)-like permease